jgi:hypothetical protein
MSGTKVDKSDDSFQHSINPTFRRHEIRISLGDPKIFEHTSGAADVMPISLLPLLSLPRPSVDQVSCKKFPLGRFRVAENAQVLQNAKALFLILSPLLGDRIAIRVAIHFTSSQSRRILEHDLKIGVEEWESVIPILPEPPPEVAFLVVSLIIRAKS